MNLSGANKSLLPPVPLKLRTNGAIQIYYYYCCYYQYTGTCTGTYVNVNAAWH